MHMTRKTTKKDVKKETHINISTNRRRRKEGKNEKYQWQMSNVWQREHNNAGISNSIALVIRIPRISEYIKLLTTNDWLTYDRGIMFMYHILGVSLSLSALSPFHLYFHSSYSIFVSILNGIKSVFSFSLFCHPLIH